MENLAIELIVKFILVVTVVGFLWGMNYQIIRLNRSIKELMSLRADVIRLENEVDNLKAFLNV